jgi:NRAMP (natural resistance-associated macrophage protein)-like metal ion transporter
MPVPPSAPARPGPLRRFFGVLGPGVITGAADDDPSGVATYSIAGAQLGTALLWTSLFTWPLMAVVQMMCARIGMVTGRGLGSALMEKLPRSLVLLTAVALLVANTLNVGADLAGMADAAHDLTGWNSGACVVVFGAALAVITVQFSYHRIAAGLKWLVLSLFAYVGTAFIAHPAWRSVIRDTLIPSWPRDPATWTMLVAILGTTISPYLFFWQTSEEVEESRQKDHRQLQPRRRASAHQLRNRRLDIGVGTFFSNLVMFFIILTCATTLHRAGVTHIETAHDAAAALQPAAGKFASLLYTVGLIGVGCLAIPTLTGSAAYALAETFRWREGLDEPFDCAREFYGVVILATICGIALNFLHVNPVKALYWSAIVNGVLSPFLLVVILLVAADRKIMQDQPSSRVSLGVVGLTAILMFGAAIGIVAS